MTRRVPEMMKAVVLDEYAGAAGLRVADLPTPQPTRGEVLIEVAATPINPSDLAFLDGNYSPRPPVPAYPGLEGSGTVVRAGPGIMGRYLTGKRVAFVAGGGGGGAWAEYVKVPSRLALPLDGDVTLEAGAMSVVNPMTALAFLEIAHSGNHRSVLNTGAAGALGQMVDRLLTSAGIRVINIVRRPAQVDELTRHGANLVLDTSSPDFDAELHFVCKQEGARLAFDAVAGEQTGRLLAAMPGEATVIVYGGLSEQPVRAEIGDLIFEGKTVTGFWLTRWLPEKNMVQSVRLWRRVQRLIGRELRSEIRSRYPLESVGDAVTDYESDMSSGKVLLTPAEGTD